MRSVNIILLFLFCILLFSCKSEMLFGNYLRQFKENDAIALYDVKEELSLRSDSTYRILSLRYYGSQEHQLKDSFLTIGRFRLVNSNIFLVPDGFSSEQFCLLYKGNKLFYYNCELGSHAKFRHPFKKAKD
jgi:hypothetical protein